MKKNVLRILLCATLLAPLSALAAPGADPLSALATLPTAQVLHPAGQTLFFHGRPVDLLLSPDGLSAFVKSDASLLVLDVPTWSIRQELPYPPGLGASMHGMAITPDGRRLYVTCAQSALVEFNLARNAQVTFSRTLKLPPAAESRRDTYPCGLALSHDARTAFVCLSTANAVARVDLDSGTVTGSIPVGIAPYSVALSSDGRTAYVSNWGGRQPSGSDLTANSAGTPVVVDKRGIACTGTVSILDLLSARETAQVPVGLHPAQILLSADGGTLCVANANSDTVSLIDTASRTVSRTLSVRPDPALPFGSAPNALALSRDARTLFVANGGNNAIAVIPFPATPSMPVASTQPANNQPAGFIPAAWYPGALACRSGVLFIANTKGMGSRYPAAVGRWNSKDSWACIQKLPIPGPDALDSFTRQILADSLVPQALKALERTSSPAARAPIPQRVGDPSLFEHVVYIIKENRTYDQVLGDIGRGNSDPSLCIFGRDITPNHHALAEQFVLLDNFYCNGVVSADGHRWATEGITSDYLEKSFGAWTRSYPSSGNDPLAYASSGFLWDNALLHGLSFRNFGEMVNCRPTPSHFTEIWQDRQDHTGKFTFANRAGLAPLEPYTSSAYPGWSLAIPDQVRADIFIKELADFSARGNLPNLLMVHLPNDHTNGTTPDYQTPAAMLADNDLALGRIVEAISKSRFWPKTCIFVVEDDPQSGFDHVDGHRSLCLVISPYTRRGALVPSFYNQTSVLHTMELILGLPPMNQFDALAPVMRDCFTSAADLRPYTALASTHPLDELNPPLSALSGQDLQLARQSQSQPTYAPDLADDNTINRVLWHSARPSTPYPAAFAGPHGKGLPALHLRLDSPKGDLDDD